MLSVAYSLNHIRKQDENVQTILAPLLEGMRAVAEARGFPLDALMLAIGNNTIREIMEMLQIDSEMILSIDRTLHGIVNRVE